MEQRFGINPFLPGYSMEAIFNYVYSDVFSVPPREDSLDAYWALVRMYAAAIARTTNRLSGKSRNGVGALLRTLWTVEEDIVFITFNQDLLIEKALERAHETSTFASVPWNTLTCYQKDFEGFLYPLRGSIFRTRLAPDGTEEPSLPILKLHGSLNWVWRAQTREDARNSIPHPGTELY